MKHENVTLQVNGFNVDAMFSLDNRDNLFIPLLKHLKHLKSLKQDRLVAFIAAPPGVGKSTLSAYLERLSKATPDLTPVQVLGLDGFHHKSDYLKSNYLKTDAKCILLNDVKGCPETFDIDKFLSYLSQINNDQVMWPIYDRTKHDVIDNQIKIKEDIVLVEGNWLLLDEHKWRDARQYADFTIFVEAHEADLKNRLVERKITGGKSKEEAEEFYERSDKKNIVRVLKHRLYSNMTLQLTKNKDYIKKEK